jgi:peptidoglycan/xylan/chitin deacetylase (PgdA/CDA1 family)
MALLSWKTKRRYLLRLQRLAARRYAGLGTILAFHRIAAGVSRKWMANEHVENTGDYLDQAVRYLKREGYEFVPIADVPVRLAARANAKRPRFAVVTLDDGYIDTYSVAYPILRGHGVPFTVYITTHFVDRQAPIWWYLLEEHLQAVTELDVEFRGETQRFRPRSPDEKRAAFVAIEKMFLSCSGAESADLATRLFGDRAVRESCDRLMMTWDQVVELHRSGLVTIGAHTCRHLVLACLDAEEARAEIRGSRQELEKRLGAPIQHFAFPYGGQGKVGAREVRLARECGLLTAVTTRQSNLFAEHIDHLHALPRTYPLSSDFSDFPLVVSGTAAAWRYRGRRLVTI